LYGGDNHYRISQEVILGIGGVRMLRALGYQDISIFHLNEGHAALLTLALLDEAAKQAGREFRELFDRTIPLWRQDNFSLRYALSIPREELWDAHMQSKKQLMGLVNRETGADMDENILTIGFARRVATYKRADLLFRAMARLKRISNEVGKIKIIYGGKAHPRNHEGKELIKRIFWARNELQHDIRMAYLENYNMTLGAMITSGVDLWLNTPEPPMEASGTSGINSTSGWRPKTWRPPLKQFNEETIETKQQRTCGEPCAAVCKKMHGIYKKDYEPYQSMGPLCGIFDQRAAEQLNHRADQLGFDAISVGGILAWLMDCLDDGLMTPQELGVDQTPRWDMATFDVAGDSMHNAELGVALLDQMILPDGKIPLLLGARKWARRLSREKGREVLDRFVYVAFARQGWMVPNQYWTPGAYAPMAITGKYYMHYGRDFLPPCELGRENGSRMLNELMLDNLGFCRFHRAWAETLLPDIVENLFGEKDAFLRSITLTASRITSRNASVFWESERNMDMVFEFLKNKKQIDGVSHLELDRWIAFFTRDKHAAAYEFWYEMHKGIHEMLREYPV
jgi:hypothetical protein